MITHLNRYGFHKEIKWQCKEKMKSNFHASKKLFHLYSSVDGNSKNQRRMKKPAKPMEASKGGKTNANCKLQIAKALMLIKHTHSTGANDSENLEFPANFSAQRFSVFRFGSIIM